MIGVLIDNEYCKKCGKCCLNTEMILTPSDIRRISSKGYNVDEYSYYDGRFYRLKNIDNHCYFYDIENGLCKIYGYRPIGCRLYPLIYTLGKGITVDKDCPQADKIGKKDIERNRKVFERILRELNIE
ncbi:MAG: YkgJ family cysteine cluster protein [Thermoprotei archaeon]|nr:MAG: YkgJ family cysteine cluster protein [Thermoprotei archaeon]